MSMGLSGGLGQLLDTIYALPWWAALLVGWAITPGMMFLLGWVGESRTLPIGLTQSKAFWPGDWFLGVVLAAAVYGLRYLPASGWWQRAWWPWLVLAVAFVHVAVERLWLDAPNYAKISGATANSPTKWWHDVVVYGGYFTIIIVVAVPVLGWASWSLGGVMARLVMLAGLSVWVLGLVYDATNPDVAPPRTDGRRPDLMHPADWRPIWRK